jgi:hypothetical protein
MKLLYLSSRGVDYLQDLTFSGLCKTIGNENICVMPWNPNFFLPRRSYPKNLGYIPGNILSSLRSHYFLKQFDAVVVAAAKPDCFHLYNELAPSLSGSVKTIFIDGGDREQVGGDLDRMDDHTSFAQAMELRPFDIILKREMITGTEYAKNVHPFPFCWNYDRLPSSIPSEKKYDVSFWAVESHPVRTEALTVLQNKFDCAANGTVLQQKFKTYKRKGEFYLQELAACRIVLNFRGVGWDTLRYWEVPSLSTFLISQRPGIVIPNNFEHEKSIVFCDGLGDLIELCEYYLRNESRREAIAAQAFLHMKAHHTDVHRAKQLLSVI